MANEKRLIDANDPLKQLSDYMEKLHCPDDYRDGLYRGMEIAESYIKNAPTVDAVEVAALKMWLYEIAMNNSDNYLGDACEVLIARLDGLREFARERRNDG